MRRRAARRTLRPARSAAFASDLAWRESRITFEVLMGFMATFRARPPAAAPFSRSPQTEPPRSIPGPYDGRPLRNAVTSGLGQGTLVVEASETSGAPPAGAPRLRARQGRLPPAEPGRGARLGARLPRPLRGARRRRRGRRAPPPPPPDELREQSEGDGDRSPGASAVLPGADHRLSAGEAAGSRDGQLSYCLRARPRITVAVDQLRQTTKDQIEAVKPSEGIGTHAPAPVAAPTRASGTPHAS